MKFQPTQTVQHRVNHLKLGVVGYILHILRKKHTAVAEHSDVRDELSHSNEDHTLSYLETNGTENPIYIR